MEMTEQARMENAEEAKRAYDAAIELSRYDPRHGMMERAADFATQSRTLHALLGGIPPEVSSLEKALYLDIGKREYRKARKTVETDPRSSFNHSIKAAYCFRQAGKILPKKLEPLCADAAARVVKKEFVSLKTEPEYDLVKIISETDIADIDCNVAFILGHREFF